MELQLTDSFNFTLNDDVDIELPLYIIRLDSKEVCHKTHRSKLILAAGVDPKDHKITLVTGDGKILIFDAQKYCIPNGPVEPTDGGKQVFFKNIKGRWLSDTHGFFADSEWIIEKSTSALQDAILQINRPCKNE